MTQHTPNSFEFVSRKRNADHHTIVTAVGNNVVAHIPHRGQCSIDAGTLFAAAPDLLEALRQVKGWMDARAFDEGSSNEVNILGWVNRAIAKAEGR